MANNNGVMAQSMRAIGKRIKWKVRDFIIWLMEVLTVENGKIINFTEMDYNKLLMVENMMASLLMESNTEKDYILGEMENNMMECGKMENNTEKVYSQLHLVKSVKVFGLMA